MTYPRLVLATGNRGKAAELAALLEGLAEDLAFIPLPSPPEETGDSYAANALIKARAWAEATGLPAAADDSGLEVAALGGAPGLRSARIVPGSDRERGDWLLAQMEGRVDRSARFVAALALVEPGGREWVRHGECRGRIALAPSGKGGFGYDPVFVPEGFGDTFAALPPEVKAAISHRAAAARALREALERGEPSCCA